MENWGAPLPALNHCELACADDVCLRGLAASVDSTEKIWQQLHTGPRAYRQNSGGLSRVMEDELF